LEGLADRPHPVVSQAEGLAKLEESRAVRPEVTGKAARA